MDSFRVVNNTYIVPDGFPAVFRPDQLDKLGVTAAITLAWPSIIGGVTLFLGTRDWRRVSYFATRFNLTVYWVPTASFSYHNMRSILTRLCVSPGCGLLQ
jgi:hypothetical protein